VGTERVSIRWSSGSFRRFILRYSVREISDSSTEEMKLALKTENLAQLVYFIRGEKVMLDADLAKLYGAGTKALNQALRRNRERFPEDFVFQLTAEEFAFLRSQPVTSNAEEPHPQELRPMSNTACGDAAGWTALVGW
jgi:hypothetical protein